MEYSEYKGLVKQMEYGKVLPDARYIHIDLMPFVPQDILGLLVSVQKDLSLQDFDNWRA